MHNISFFSSPKWFLFFRVMLLLLLWLLLLLLLVAYCWVHEVWVYGEKFTFQCCRKIMRNFADDDEFDVTKAIVLQRAATQSKISHAIFRHRLLLVIFVIKTRNIFTRNWSSLSVYCTQNGTKKMANKKSFSFCSHFSAVCRFRALYVCINQRNHRIMIKYYLFNSKQYALIQFCSFNR